MNINYKQTQFELFPGQAEASLEESKPRFLSFRVTLNFENIIILTIVLFVAIILFFSLGVERGKRAFRSSTHDSQVDAQVTQDSELRLPLESTAMPVELEPTKNVRVLSTEESPVTIESVVSDFYTVQVASFKTREYAEREAQKLKVKGYEVFIVPKGSHLIVCAGKFFDKKEANGFSQKLKDQYKDCLVRRL